MGLKWLISILWAFKGALHAIPEILQFNMKNVGNTFPNLHIIHIN